MKKQNTKIKRQRWDTFNKKNYLKIVFFVWQIKFKYIEDDSKSVKDSNDNFFKLLPISRKL